MKHLTRRVVLGTVPTVPTVALAACAVPGGETSPAPSTGPVKLVHSMHQNPARNAAVEELISTYRQ